MKFVVCTLFAGAFLAFPARAEEPRSVQYKQCTDRDSTEIALRMCADAELKRQDGSLNAAYKEAMSATDGAQKQKLLESQRLWIKMRDATCGAFALKYEGGTLGPRTRLDCLIDQTIRRSTDLHELVEF